MSFNDCPELRASGSRIEDDLIFVRDDGFAGQYIRNGLPAAYTYGRRRRTCAWIFKLFKNIFNYSILKGVECDNAKHSFGI